VQQALERAVVPLYALYIIRSSTSREGVLATVADCLQQQDRILAAYRSGNFQEASQVARDFLVRMKAYLKVNFPG
jgi:DNA-binding FadR family transcriptional regulator